MVPFPDPLPPLETVSQLPELSAVHAQPVPAVTLTLPLAAAVVTERDAGETAYAQAAAACVNANVLPAIVSRPTRWAVVGFAWTA